MRSRHGIAAALITLGLLASGGPAPAEEKPEPKLKVVATFSILADMVKNIGGERIELATLVGPGADAHVYSPSPADARTLAGARLVVTNGLGFEGWINRLVKASATKAKIAVATRGIKARHAPGGHGHGHDSDPHAWQSVANARIYVANIRDALSEADPAGTAAYASNAAAYLERLDQLEAEVRDAIEKIPADRRKVITTHDAFGYFGAAYGITFVAPQGVSTEAEVAAKDVAAIISQIRKQRIPAVFLENVTDARLLNRISAESGARVGGTLYSDALTDEKGEAPSYIDMIRHNVKQLSTALMS